MRPVRSAHARHQPGLIREALDGRGWWVAGRSMSGSEGVPPPLPAGLLTTRHQTNYRAPAHLSTPCGLPTLIATGLRGAREQPGQEKR